MSQRPYTMPPHTAKLIGAKRISEWAGWFAWYVDRSNGYGRPGYRWRGRYRLTFKTEATETMAGIAIAAANYYFSMADAAETFQRLGQALDRMKDDWEKFARQPRAKRPPIKIFPLAQGAEPFKASRDQAIRDTIGEDKMIDPGIGTRIEP